MASPTLLGLSLRDLEYAVAVADLAHFGRAAERCGVSQAGLSEQVRKLEAVLGVALFERGSRRTTVTTAGEPLVRQARQVLNAARVLLELARTQSEPLTGRLRIGAIATLAPYYLPGLLREVRARFPRLDLRLQEGQTDLLTGALLAGELDLVMVALPTAHEGIGSMPLFFEPFRALLPAGHRLADSLHIRVQDLAGDGLLLLQEGHCLRDQALSLCGRASDRSERYATSLEMLRNMVAAGEGHSLLPMLAADSRSDLDGLVEVRTLEGREAGRTIGLVWRNTDPRAGSFAEFGEFLRETAPPGTQAVA